MKAINEFLLKNRIFLKDNPAVSPDFTLNYENCLKKLKENEVQKNFIIYDKSELAVGESKAVLCEDLETGDHIFLLTGDNESNSPFSVMDDFRNIKPGAYSWPCTFENLIKLKNILQKNDPESTVFPAAVPPLDKRSLGIGARFTTLHYPAVAWAMSALSFSLTANQNSIPRELVYDTEAMLEGRLTDVPFPFIGAAVPEGHQGQSVQGMTHASILQFLKYGFHKKKLPHGFNADHQPVGGRYDTIEDELVSGSLFASYITFDLSPELSITDMPENAEAASLLIKKMTDSDRKILDSVRSKLEEFKIEMKEDDLLVLFAYLMPSMKKFRKRYDKYVNIRNEKFTAEKGKKFYIELSIDELPGETTPSVMAVCLAASEALGIEIDYTAPNIGFQKNTPYPDNTELAEKLAPLCETASKFGVSIGFHSGSGKSAKNYSVCGEQTDGGLEIKTSGRYTYEMGVALSKSSDPEDGKLWKEWYDFTKKLALEGAFSEDETRKKFSRHFISESFKLENLDSEGIFDSPANLSSALDSLSPSPDHMHWFEYNFLFVMAVEGGGLGDHSPAGYMQRKRFYTISEEAKLLYSKGVVTYICFLAESTGMLGAKVCDDARRKLRQIETYSEFLESIV
ncbi:MAG: tagaturonate epimerase family protein [Fibrobacterota bacterium]